MHGILASSSRPPLCVAADFGQKEVIAYLIENGADVNVCFVQLIVGYVNLLFTSMQVL